MKRGTQFMSDYDKRNNLSAVGSCFFILSGILSIFYCIVKVHEGKIIFMDFSDCIFIFLIILMSAFIIFIGIWQLHTGLRNSDEKGIGRAQTSIMHKLIKLFWYPEEYYKRKNSHIRTNKIKHHIGVVVTVMAAFLIGAVFFYLPRLILPEMIIKIFILISIIVYCRKYLM